MKQTQKIFVAAILLATVAILLYLLEHARRTSTDEAITRVPTNGEISLEPRNSPRQHKTSSVTEHEVISYNLFKKKKECFDRQQETQSILRGELESLRDGLNEVDAKSRPMVEEEIRRKEAQLAIIPNCTDGKPTLTLDELSDLLSAAARAGDQMAQVEYATNPLIDPFHAITNIDRLREWRNTALGYVNSAIDSGNAQAMIALAGAYDPFHCQASNNPTCSGLLSEVVDQDAEKSYRYYYLVQLMGRSDTPAWVSTELAALEHLLTSDEVSRAQFDARAKYQAITNVLGGS